MANRRGVVSCFDGGSSSRVRQGLAIAGSLLIASAGIVRCASAEPYNPQHLDGGRLGRIADICQTTMGLSASEPYSMVWGAAQDPHLDPGENHYQGCIASLSDAAADADAGRATVRADLTCRAQGYRDSTPGLAECVLRSEGEQRTAQPVDDPVLEGRKASSFYYASPHTIRQRERLACAEVGLNPVTAAFDNCVSRMDGTFDRIDNPSF
jgi:hypothetical protein